VKSSDENYAAALLKLSAHRGLAILLIANDAFFRIYTRVFVIVEIRVP
jgi:hypothetical protein